MRKLLSRRPSAGDVIAFIALCVALGGGAYAATSKKVEYKGLSKDARLKVLRRRRDERAAPTVRPEQLAFTCAPRSRGRLEPFPRKFQLTFDGIFDGQATPPPTASATLEVDCSSTAASTAPKEPTTSIHGAGANDSRDFGINIVTTPQGGKHTYSVACNEPPAISRFSSSSSRRSRFASSHSMDA